MEQATTLGEGLESFIEPEREFTPIDIYEIGAMLTNEERLLLHSLGRTGPPGAIVELGAFLGGSTLALASGADHRDAQVHSFDRFRLSGDWEKEWFPEGFDAAPGDSTLPIYRHNIDRVKERVIVHEGDICDASWGEPIGVLFIDVAKAWSTADAVWNTFFPWLQPGSILVQQDLVHWGHPWCPIIMEHLAHHFEYLGWTWLGSSVWRCKTVPDNIPPVMFEAFTCEEMLDLIDRAAERVGDPAAGSIRLSGAQVLIDFGRLDEAEARVDEIRATLDNEKLPFIEEGFAAYDKLILAKRADRKPLT